MYNSKICENMKTNKFISILLIGLAFLYVSGCEDDQFLEEKPKSLYTLNNAFEKSSQVEAQLTMCYYRMYTFYASAPFFGLNPFMFKSFGTDALDQPFWQTGGSAGYSNFSTWSSTSDFVETVWNNLYELISYANLTFLGTEAEDISWASDDLKKQLKAEASFFRGLGYLRLAELYGGVPIVTEFSEELKLDYTRSTREETYQVAIDNLLYAYNNLPDYPAEIGRVAKGAAANMLSEAYLAMGVETGDNSNYTEAINYATETINLHPLMTARFGVRADPGDASTNRGVATYLPNGNVYGDLFYPGNYDLSTNTEAVWVLQTPTYEQADETGGQSSNGGWMFGPALRDLNWKPEFVEEGAAPGPWKAIDPPYNTASFPAYLGGFGISQAMPPNYACYDVWTDPDDIRYEEDVTVRTLYECTDQNHSMFGQKVPMSMLDQNPNVFSKYSPIFSKLIPLDEWQYRNTDIMHFTSAHDAYGIRSAETYLLRAEAYLRNGQNDLAADDINTVRQRAECTIMYTAANVDINSILDERLRECLFEEGRWFTFLRMEPAVWKQRLYDHAMFIHDYVNYTIPIPFDLWPIPQKIRELNTGAEFPQNTGW
jgi:tetratricopeptide (TPR) repeat protein